MSRNHLKARQEFFTRGGGAGALRGLALGEPLGRQPALPDLRRHWNDALGDPTGKRVLELGCGEGGELLDLTRRGARAVGLELTPSRLETARLSVPGAAFVTADAERPPFLPATFDLVLGNSVLLHLDRRRTLTATARLLAPGGRAVFLEPLGRHPLLRLYRRWRPRHGMVDFPTLEELERLPTACGLRVLEVTAWYLTAALPTLAERLSRRRGALLDGLSRRLARLDNRLFRDAAFRRRAWLALAVYTMK